MRDWIIVVVLYFVGIGLFRILGGFGAAAGAFRRWGKASSAIRNSPTSS
jgi:hypothetical protein